MLQIEAVKLILVVTNQRQRNPACSAYDAQGRKYIEVMYHST
jgi:hypothetical protein